MATRAEIEKQIAKLQKDLDSAPEYDEDETLCVELPDGHKVYLKGERLAKYLRQHGLEVDDVEIESEEAVEEPSEEPKKAVAKKTAAPRKRAARKPTEVSEEEIEDDILEPDGEPEGPRSYWG